MDEARGAWKVTCCTAPDGLPDGNGLTLMANGWEPFAVTQYPPKIWFRRWSVLQTIRPDHA